MVLGTSEETKMARLTAKQWNERVEAWKASGKTAEEFALRRGIDARQLHWWKWHLSRRKPAGGANAASFVPVRVAEESPTAARPRSVRRPRSSPTASTDLVEVTLPSGIVLRVPAGFGARALAEVIAAVERASCGCFRRRFAFTS